MKKYFTIVGIGFGCIFKKMDENGNIEPVEKTKTVREMIISLKSDGYEYLRAVDFEDKSEKLNLFNLLNNKKQ